MDLDVTYLGALVAGLLSFASPCVLPLVPPYLCFLGGVTLDQIGGGAGDAVDRGVARRVFLAAVAFVLGFATVFVAMGASASAISGLVTANAGWLAKIAGTLIVLFGLHVLGLLRIGLLAREARLHPQRRPAGLAGAYLVGLAFAFGWSPCIGPVLASILIVAGAQDAPWRGAALLGVYAAGLGAPFLLAALFVRPFLGVLRRSRPLMHRVEQAMGALLVATGLLIVAGSFPDIGVWLLQTFPVLGKIG